jgi:hypothetical protein
MDLDPESGFDPGTRRLCPDGACIGVLDADGVCGECGRKFGADAIALAAANAKGEWASLDAAETAPAEPSAPGDFDPERRMCPDGGCIGVIGAGGACTVCGRVAG